jgi:hypothetical protein
LAITVPLNLAIVALLKITTRRHISLTASLIGILLAAITYLLVDLWLLDSAARKAKLIRYRAFFREGWSDVCKFGMYLLLAIALCSSHPTPSEPAVKQIQAGLATFGLVAISVSFC